MKAIPVQDKLYINQPNNNAVHRDT